MLKDSIKPNSSDWTDFDIKVETLFLLFHFRTHNRGNSKRSFATIMILMIRILVIYEKPNFFGKKKNNNNNVKADFAYYRILVHYSIINNRLKAQQGSIAQW